MKGQVGSKNFGTYNDTSSDTKQFQSRWKRREKGEEAADKKSLGNR